MKRFLAVLVFSALSVSADVWTSGDWFYQTGPEGASIKYYLGSGGAIVIPSELDGFPIVGVGGWGPIFGDGRERNPALITDIVIPNGVSWIGMGAFSNTSITRINIPSSVTNIGSQAFYGCSQLQEVTMNGNLTEFSDSTFVSCPSLKMAYVPNNFNNEQAGRRFFSPDCTLISPSFIDALATNDAFVTAVANKIKGTSGNFGLATQSGLSNAVTSVASNLATKVELTASLAQSRTDGINSVLSNPNLWTLYTTNQISAMAIGDLVLTRTNNGSFVLNYDIEQSDDLANWYPYQNFSMPLTNLPTDKAFVRIKAKQ